MNMIRKNGGFTLVELIVVIAILAILGSVGTVGYSAYIDKTNQAADRSLVFDIEQALIMGAYSKNYAPGPVGGVGISRGDNNDAKPSNNDIAVMMENSFGENWEDTLRLQYDWSDLDENKVLGAMQGVNADYFGSVQDSSFYSTSGATQDLAAKVDEIAGAFKGILGEKNGYVFGSFWNDDFRKKVNDADLDITDSQTAANLTVMAAANAIANSNATTQKAWIDSWSGNTNVSVNATESGYVAPLVMNYAKYVALVSYVNDPANNVDPDDVYQVNSSYDTLVAAMAGLSNNSGEGGSYVTAFNDALKDFEDATIKNVNGTIPNVYNQWQSSGQAKTDAEAFLASMAAVNALEDTYVNKDKEDMLNKSNAFTDFGAADILDTMVSYAGMSNLHGSEIIIELEIGEDGTPIVHHVFKED